MANFNFSKAFIGGRLTHDPELRQTAAGKSMCKCSIAVSKKRRASYEGTEEFVEKTNFLDIVAFNKQAEFLCQYFKKGNAIFVTAEPSQNVWTDQEGQKKSKIEFLVEQIEFVDSKNQLDEEFDDKKIRTADTTPLPGHEGKFRELEDDDDLPF